MAASEKQLAEKLKEAGTHLLSPPSSVEEEVEKIIENVEQSPSETMQDTLWPTRNELVSKGLLGYSDFGTGAVCFSCLRHALNVQIYLKMCRSDYAEKQLKIMQQIDEDHTLTELANAWFNLAMGGSKIQEAYLIYQDFSEKYPTAGIILNGKAVCCMHMGNFDEAESFLLEALNKASYKKLKLFFAGNGYRKCKAVTRRLPRETYESTGCVGSLLSGVLGPVTMLATFSFIDAGHRSTTVGMLRKTLEAMMCDMEGNCCERVWGYAYPI